MHERDLVKDAILAVFNQSGYHDPAQMTQRDFDYISKGCANLVYLLLGKEIKNSETDLTALTFDVSQWADVEIASINNMVSIYINNRKVFSAPSFNRVKYISGLAFISNGLCEVDNVDLTGLDGKIVYKNAF